VPATRGGDPAWSRIAHTTIPVTAARTPYKTPAAGRRLLSRWILLGLAVAIAFVSVLGINPVFLIVAAGLVVALGGQGPSSSPAARSSIH
jgi:hypothetical protein